MINPRHPGQILAEDYMRPSGLSAFKLAKTFGLTTSRISRLMRCEHALTADTALYLASYFGGNARDWLMLQVDYDLSVAVSSRTEKAKKRKA